jgi:broad specificity phosphatase PhoE
MDCILLIRHAEKPHGSIKGVDADGTKDDEALTARGWQRAGALAVWFGSKEGLPKPDRIYASAPERERVAGQGKVGSKSSRPVQTVSPLAEKMPTTIIQTYTKDQEPALVDELVGLKGTTLVCWQHEAIPAIAKIILGTDKGVPDPWPDDRFDVVWRFVRSGAGQTWSFDQVCQRVLDGDKNDAIA